ncbi:MAG: sensor histidine kinase [Nitrospirota bacterium]|nr:sensor histidine kinase [Nitrospirota bacterium]
MNVFKSIAASLPAKMVIILGLLITVGGSIFWYISIRTDEKNLMDNAITFVSSFSEVVKKSVRDDMLHFQRADIQRTLESIGDSESIAKVQIFDAKGVIFYSSDRKGIGQRVDHDSHACVGCHKDPAGPSELILKDKRWNIYTNENGFRVLSFVEPIYNETDCYTAACHAHDRGQKVLGIMTMDISLYPIDMKIRRQMIETSFYIVIFLAVTGSILYCVLWRFVLSPVTSLSAGMENVISGDLSQRVPATSGDEIGRLTNTFNAMTGELHGARQRMEQWTQALEEEVKKKKDEILNTQGKLIQTEKMAALGRITADIAHEIRNPLTALGGFGRRLQKISCTEKEKVYADIIVSEVQRLEQILRDVMTFSRDVKICFEKMPVTEMVKDCVTTFSALCEEHDIKIDARYGTDLPVLIDRGQAGQAVKNLISNAIDVMPGGGILSVTTVEERYHEVAFVALHISDTGSGIPDAQLPFIFEPFHTTKEIGRGTGLGLSISRKIIEEHGGFIKAENRRIGGLRASLFFPYQSEEDLSKVPCWEFMKCERHTGKEMKCPAYPHFGRVCWVVGGTFCEGKIQGTFAQKCEDCRKCEFYEKVVSGEI